MTFEATIVVWCSALLLAGFALVSLVVVEIRMLASWWRARRARRRGALPRAQLVDAKKQVRVRHDDQQ